ncbi:MAG: hypothetical protein CMH49_07230 [Myxococcales bacterium]|nr:hypothetical protein [Myxococcales bacterium]
MSQQKPLNWAYSLILLLGLSIGCADSAGPTYTGTNMAGAEMGGMMNVGGTVIQPGAQLALRSETNQNIVDVGGNLELRLRYVMNNTDPVARQRVSFELLNQSQMPAPQGVDGTGLSALSTTTNERGEASVTVIAGQMPTAIVVKAFDPSNVQVAPIYWRVTVANSGEGGLEVTVNYNAQNGRYNFNQFSAARVTLFQNTPCDQIRASAPNFVNAYESLPEIYPYTDLDNKVNSASLPNGLVLSIAALIYNQGGAPVTFGCVEGIRPQGGQILPVEVVTGDLPLAFKGVYTSLNRFDLIQALQDSEELSTLGDIFYFLRILGGSNEQLGAGVIETICRIADFQGVACEIIEGVAGGALGNIINNQIPENVKSVLRIVGETLDIVGDLTIVGEIEFSQSANADRIFVGNDNRWQRLRFNWDVDCQMPGMCQREVTFSQLGDHSSRNVAGLFDAQEQADGTVAILEHNFAIAYGNIILGLLEAWILPLAYGDGSGTPIALKDFLEINLSGVCESINERFNLPSDSDTCINALAIILSGVINEQVGRLNFTDDQLVMRGSFTPRDNDNDLSIDKLDNGQWIGVIDGNLEFRGCFTACRGGECEGPVCQVADAGNSTQPNNNP